MSIQWALLAQNSREWWKTFNSSEVHVIRTIEQGLKGLLAAFMKTKILWKPKFCVKWSHVNRAPLHVCKYESMYLHPLKIFLIYSKICTYVHVYVRTHVCYVYSTSDIVHLQKKFTLHTCISIRMTTHLLQLIHKITLRWTTQLIVHCFPTLWPHNKPQWNFLAWV
jgi:hypothetical protein